MIDVKYAKLTGSRVRLCQLNPLTHCNLVLITCCCAATGRDSKHETVAVVRPVGNE